MLYAFILGKNTALSVAEITSVLKRDLFVFIIISISGKALVIKVDKKIENPQVFLDHLGGTIKIVEVFSSLKEKDVKGQILGYVQSNFKEQKFVFGISSYGASFPRLGFEIKKALKEVGINSRFVMGKEKELSAPEIQNNKILSHGADFVLIRDGNQSFVGKTIAIQDYETYSHRDYDRPRRNAKSGMLPPKVAQIMINLIPTNPNDPKAPTNPALIYDPFCGNGTVLQEALIMGHKIIGSDLSKDRAYDTIQNLSWLKEQLPIEIKPEKAIFRLDAQEVSIEDLPQEPDAIVSEVYLGPPLTSNSKEEDLEKTVRELEIMYQKFFVNAYKNLPSVKYMILALPFYKLRNRKYHLNIFDQVQKIGYNIISPIEKAEIDMGLLPEYNVGRKTILYSREDQIVGREIVILNKR